MTRGVQPPAVVGHAGIVSTSNYLASLAGARVLSAGGTAADAAVTISLVLGVAEGYHSGIGGGAFFVFRDGARRTIETLDARGTAPLSARPDMFITDGRPDHSLSRMGPTSVALPTLIAGLEELHRRAGRLPWSRLVTPAARLARDGFPVGHAYHIVSESPESQERLRRNPALASVFLRDGRSRRPGETILQPHLAATLDAVSADGPTAFYEGAVAQDIEEATEGRITVAELRAYTPRLFDPIRVRYGDHELFSMGPPSSGGIAIAQSLGLLEPLELRHMGSSSVQATHYLAEALRVVYADRSRHVGDPPFHDTPVEWLTSRAYLESRARRFRADRADTEVQPGLPDDIGSSTTHFVVADRHGGIVTCTQTVGHWFGSGIMTPRSGVVLNNNMGDFAPGPGLAQDRGVVYHGTANCVEPGKTPLSSNCPTIVLRNGEPVLALGGAGGPRIISSTIQVLLNVLEHGMSIDAAIAAPRVHHQGAALELERAFGSNVITALGRMGHDVDPIEPGVMHSSVYGIAISDDGAYWIGGRETRKDTHAVGCIEVDGVIWFACGGFQFLSPDQVPSSIMT